VTSGWPRERLGELLTKSDDWTKILPDNQYKEITVRLWGRGVTLRRNVNGAEIKSLQRIKVRPRQFIISRIDARNGACGLVPDELDGAVVSNDFPVFRINEQRLYPGYLGWLSKTRYFVASCWSVSEGTTNRVRLKEEEFFKIEIPLPPLSEQQRIVAKIDKVAAKIEEVFTLKKAVTDLSEKMLAGVFHRIVDKAPYLPMENVAPLVRRPVDVQANEVYLELGVRSFGKGTFHKPALPGSEVGTKKLYRIEAGDIVLSNVFAWEGGIAVAKKEDSGRVGSHRFITRVPVSTKATANFIKYYLLTPEGLEKIGKASPGGAGRNRTLGLKKLDSIEVPIPSIEKQCYFDRLVDKVDALKAFHGVTASQLNAVVPKVLDAAFAGPG
jgi:type I restriction enzyme S subunit